MSARGVERALACLTAAGAVLASAGADFGVYPRGDRRRRPVARLKAAEVRALESEGAIAREGHDGFVLTSSGHSRVRRDAAPAGEAFAAQHAPLIDRSVVESDGALRVVRGFDASIAVRRLAGLRDASGKPWLTTSELAAASALRGDWEASQAGLARGSDWAAPPKGGTPRAGNGQEVAMAARCDARRRFEDRLATLAAPLRRAVERVVLYDDGVEALERAEGWPARSGKVALKLGLAQLALR